ncbi:hypothetical protein RHMOL_Rhmol03G0069700 [Rhododendron molle]|uniref:Uncharacterized protein n=1 Tax=Rhododendron molle TaxID=49168 RepID=A0ACC0PCL4_RHOML|nr:hypothetical protein RHMOL_Rhmol03G0069700 [Rhododendron molle]
MVWSQIQVEFDTSFDIRVGSKKDAKMYYFYVTPGEVDSAFFPSFEVVEGMFEKFLSMSMVERSQKMATHMKGIEVDPAFFPSYEVVKGMFEKFVSISMVKRSQKMVTHKGYLRGPTVKSRKRTGKRGKMTSERVAKEEVNKIFEGSDLRELDIGRLNKLSLLIVDKLKELEERKVGSHQLAAPPLPRENGRSGGISG